MSMTLRIAFINPCSSNAEIMHKCPPYGILSLISYLKGCFKDRVEIRYFDDFLESDTKKGVENFFPQLIGISSTTATICRAYELADYFKEKKIGRVVLGGKHPSVLPYESAQHADYVVVGEGEKGLSSLVQSFLDGKQHDQRLIDSTEIADLDSIPPIPWDVLNKDYYMTGNDTIGTTVGFDKKGRSIGLVTSRGCPFRCTFCYNSKRSSQVRFFSPERVVSEVEFMLKEWNVDSIFFFDDEFLSNKERVRKICDLIKRKDLKFHWTCQARADIVDIEILKLIKQCGCIQVDYGFESGSQRILEFLKGEKASVKKNKNAIAVTKKAALRVYGNIILGTPTETYVDFLKSFYFIMSNPIDVVATSLATAYPGTKLWDYCIENGIFKPGEIDYSRLSLLKNTYYLNERHISRKKFVILFFIYRFFVFLFKRDYSPREIIGKVFRKIRCRSLDAK